MQHEPASCQALAFRSRPNFCVRQKLSMILECMFENGKLAVYIDFETLIGCVMDYRCVLHYGPRVRP